MAKKNSAKKRQSRVLDAMRRENAILEKQKEKKARKEEQARKSVGEQQREKRREGRKDFTRDAALKTKESAGIQKRKVRERKNQNKIVKGVRVGNITKIRKNVSYGGIIIKDSASKQAVLDMLKAEDRMMR